jgi:hypothetical protein
VFRAREALFGVNSCTSTTVNCMVARSGTQVKPGSLGCPSSSGFQQGRPARRSSIELWVAFGLHAPCRDELLPARKLRTRRLRPTAETVLAYAFARDGHLEPFDVGAISFAGS